MFDAKQGGAHLSCVRSWIQRKAANGERVTWGSDERLQLYGFLTPKVLEDLACDIAEAVARGILEMDRLGKVWEERGCPPFKLVCNHRHSIVIEIEGDGKREYLSLGSALRSLFHILSRKVNRDG